MSEARRVRLFPDEMAWAGTTTDFLALPLARPETRLSISVTHREWRIRFEMRGRDAEAHSARLSDPRYVLQVAQAFALHLIGPSSSSVANLTQLIALIDVSLDDATN